MARYAIIEGSAVVNVIVWDGDVDAWGPPDGGVANLLPDDSPVGPGYTYDGTTYTPPPNPKMTA